MRRLGVERMVQEPYAGRAQNIAERVPTIQSLTINSGQTLSSDSDAGAWNVWLSRMRMFGATCVFQCSTGATFRDHVKALANLPLPPETMQLRGTVCLEAATSNRVLAC
jgi:hypothetical protein